MKGTKEFYELREAFERALKNMPIYIACDSKQNRSPRENKEFYDNGQLNQLFIAYMCGYQNAKLEFLLTK